MTSTTTDTVLAGLDDIDWASLEHAYGEAADVPAQLRALCGEDPEGRRQAVHTLYSNIFHQGSRYGASAFAVPFLARLAAAPGLPDRAEAVALMAALAIGYDESHLPDGLAVEQWRRQIEELRAQDPAEVLAAYDAWVAEATDEGERRVRDFRRRMYDHDRQLASAEAELAAYDAVRREVPALTALLADAEPAVRAATAYLLAWFPEEAATTLPGLLDLARRETNPAVSATALVAVGLLGDAATAAVLRPFLTVADRSVRWGAAIALARLGSAGAESAVDAAVLAELAAAEAEEPEPGAPGIPFHEGDLRGYAAVALAQLADRYPAEALDAVTTGLASAVGPAAFPVTAAALRLAFGPELPAALPAFAELDPGQQRLVRALASLGEDTWRWGNFLEILHGWRLPHSRPELRTYAGLTAD
ncbi:HEAT repeat domain-containing protein [Kitasatospora cinereorecta]|uniref:HEAT repeat domain-containing protein n=1 Tax=Kitasatospora cinereorecta TaxID=285560 RepID=A0ABW0V4S0_9ACTN